MKKFHRQIGVGGLVISGHERKLVNQVLKASRLTYGPMTKRFEAAFAKSHGCPFALFMNSGTDALRIALAVLKERNGWKDGDEVIVPAVTFIATSNIVLQNRMTPVFADVERDTYTIDPKEVERRITGKTRAVIPVHLLGLPAAMAPILDLAKRHRLAVIEDSCECMFARYQGRLVGGWGDIGCFSTYVAHLLVTGVGGLATTSDPALAMGMRSMMNHGRDNIYLSCTDDQGVGKSKLREIVEKRFKFTHVGYSSRCTEMEAAMGLGQLARASKIMSRRRQIAAFFTKELSRYSDVLQLPVCPPDRTHSYMLYGLAVRRGDKKRLVHHLEDLNIETRDLLPLTNQPIYQNLFGDIEDRYPVAKWANESAFYIGCHPYMTDEEMHFVARAFHAYFSGKRR